MKKSNGSDIYQIVMGVSISIVLISSGFALAMLMMELVEKIKLYGTLSIVGLVVMCLSFITFVATIVLDRKHRKRKNPDKK